MNIVFVCTGNTCRSPMAMGIFNALANSMNLPHHAVSRGIAAFPTPATENAVAAAKIYGADLSGHIACQIDEETMKNAGRVYGLTRRHVEVLVSAFPQYKHKIFPISDEDIPDPYGGSFEQYEETAYRIKDAVSEIIEILKETDRDKDEDRNNRNEAEPS